jgi:hypothetical protein
VSIEAQTVTCRDVAKIRQQITVATRKSIIISELKALMKKIDEQVTKSASVKRSRHAFKHVK